MCGFRNHHDIAVFRDAEWVERGEITLEAAAKLIGVCNMTALRMLRRGEIKGRQACAGAPWVTTVGIQFCCAAQRSSRCGRLKVPLAPGGLRETARHSKPETRETAVPQADEAEAQQRAHGSTSSKSQRSRPTKATRPADPRARRGAGAAGHDQRDPRHRRTLSDQCSA